jgi:hypothetical protein
MHPQKGTRQNTHKKTEARLKVGLRLFFSFQKTGVGSNATR